MNHIFFLDNIHLFRIKYLLKRKYKGQQKRIKTLIFIITINVKWESPTTFSLKPKRTQ